MNNHLVIDFKDITRKAIIESYVNYFTNNIMLINLTAKEMDSKISKYRMIDIAKLRNIMFNDPIFNELLYPPPFDSSILEYQDTHYINSKKRLYYENIDNKPYFVSTVLNEKILYEELNELICLNLTTIKRNRIEKRILTIICIIIVLVLIFRGCS